MYKIATLIVEDNQDSRRIIAEGIDAYNKSQMAGEYYIEVIGEAENYVEAHNAISIHADIQLVFLDINFISGGKNGFEIFKEFPEKSYILVSQNSTILEQILNEAKHRPHSFVAKASEGGFNMVQIVNAIHKYIDEKRADFFNKVITFKDYNIILDDVVFISKARIKVSTNNAEGKFYLEPMRKNKKGSNPNHFFCYDRITTTVDIISSQVLDSVHIQTTKKNISLLNIIDTNSLDPNIFFRISKSIIINCNFVESFDTKNHRFTVRVRDFNNQMRRMQQNVYAYIDGSKEYLDAATKERILSAIQRRFHRS